MFTLTLSSHFGSPRESWLHINVVVNWQLSRQGIRWPVSPDRIVAQVSTHQRRVFFEVIRWQFTRFQMIAGAVFLIHIKYVVFMSLSPSTITVLILNWPQTQKFSQYFWKTGEEDLFLTWSRVAHAPCPIFMLWLVKIWQVSSCVKFIQHILKVVYFDSWSWHSFESTEIQLLS